jgi:hypothetical protein
VNVQITDDFLPEEGFPTRRDLIEIAHEGAERLRSVYDHMRHIAAAKGVATSGGMLTYSATLGMYRGHLLEAMMMGDDPTVYIRTREEMPQVLAIVD